jgi:hypothetical protein
MRKPRSVTRPSTRHRVRGNSATLGAFPAGHNCRLSWTLNARGSGRSEAGDGTRVCDDCLSDIAQVKVVVSAVATSCLSRIGNACTERNPAATARRANCGQR